MTKSIKKSNSEKIERFCDNQSRTVVMVSVVVSPQWLSYFNDQVEFLKKLDQSISSKTTVRLYRHDLGWGQE